MENEGLKTPLFYLYTHDENDNIIPPYLYIRFLFFFFFINYNMK